MSTRVTDFLPLIRPIVEILWFSTKIYALVGSTASSMFGAYLVVGAGIIRLFMPNFTKIVGQESQAEGNSRKSLSIVTTNYLGLFIVDFLSLLKKVTTNWSTIVPTTMPRALPFLEVMREKRKWCKQDSSA